MKNVLLHTIRKETNMKKFFLFTLIFCLICLPNSALAAPVRETDTSTPAEGNVIVKVRGSYEKPNVAEALKQINSYRKEACEKGYPDPRDKSRKLTKSDYHPVKWSGDLEWIAMIRAAESTLWFSHSRPGGRETPTYNSVYGQGECLATPASVMGGIWIWYMEKDDWVKQTGRVTGHYTSMINPNVKYIAVSSFCVDGVNSSAAAKISFEDNLKEYQQTGCGYVDQKIEIKKSHLLSPVIEDNIGGESSVPPRCTVDYSVKRYVVYPGPWDDPMYIPTVFSADGWKSSNPSVASITNEGKLTAHKEGKTTITVNTETGINLSKTISVVPPYVGTRFKNKGITYRIRKRKTEVEVYNAKKVSGVVAIPNTVFYEGRTYKVTKISSSAFKNNNKVTTVKLGININKIGSKAFYNCKKLKKLVIFSSLLNKSNVGKNAFSNTKIKTVKCPKGKKKIYKKIFRQKGIRKSAKFK